MAKREKIADVANGVTAESDKPLLEAAAVLIIESGTKEIDVSELAKRSQVKRPTIYARYGRGQRQSVGTTIYLRILSEFLKSAGSSIQGALALVDQRSPTPGEELAAILRATLSAFKRNQLFGKVVLQELSLSNPGENDLVRPIFDAVHKIVKNARGQKHLDQGPKDDWKVRQILFVLTRGLLRTLYLDQYDKRGNLLEKSEMTEKEVEIEILRVLGLYSLQQSEKKVKETIEVIDKRNDKRSQSDSR